MSFMPMVNTCCWRASPYSALRYEEDVIIGWREKDVKRWWQRLKSKYSERWCRWPRVDGCRRGYVFRK